MAPIDDVAMPFLLMTAFRGLVDAVHADLEDAGFPGVRATHGFAMQAVGEGCTSVELGVRLGVSKQAAAKTAAGLEAMGFITRMPARQTGESGSLPRRRAGARCWTASAASFRREVARWRERVGNGKVDATLATLAQAPPVTTGFPF